LQPLDHLADQIFPFRGRLIDHRLQLAERRAVERGQLARAGGEQIFGFGDAADETLSHRFGIGAVDGVRAARPRIEDAAQLLFVAERVRAVRFDHQRMPAIASFLVGREVGMDRLRHVAKKFPDRIGRKARLRIRHRSKRRRRRPLRVRNAFGDLAQLRFRDRGFQFVQLLVQMSNFLTIADSKGGERRLRARDRAALSVERRLELRHASSKRVHVMIVRSSGADQGPHIAMIHTTIVNVGYRSTNYWVISAGTNRVLVDLGWPGMIGALKANLDRAGVPLAEIRYAIATHYHIDHAGAAEDLKRLGVPLMVLESQVGAIPMMKQHTKPQDNYTEITSTGNLVVKCADTRALFAKIGIAGEVVPT